MDDIIKRNLVIIGMAVLAVLTVLKSGAIIKFIKAVARFCKKVASAFQISKTWGNRLANIYKNYTIIDSFINKDKKDKKNKGNKENKENDLAKVFFPQRRIKL